MHGVVASLGVTEFMLVATGVRARSGLVVTASRFPAGGLARGPLRGGRRHDSRHGHAEPRQLGNRNRTLAYLARSSIKRLDRGEHEDRIQRLEDASGPRLSALPVGAGAVWRPNDVPVALASCPCVPQLI